MSTEATNRRLAKVVLYTFGICSLAGVGFFGAYAMAGAVYQQYSPPEVAAVIAARPDPFASTTLIAKAAYVKDLTTGETLYELNPDAQLPLASITKVPLTLAVTEALPKDSIVTIPAHQTPDGAPIRIASGGEWHLQDLIDFTLAASSNEGADILARDANSAIAAQYPQAPQDGGVSATLWRMNDLGKQLGLTNTYFLDVTGLDLSTTQSGASGSAKDVAAIFAYAASTSPSVFEATTQDIVIRSSIDGQSITGQNTDAALPSIPGLLMGKTGYTDLAGGNLAVVFTALDGHRVVAVVLGSTQDGRFTDMKQLIPAAQQAVAQGR